MSQDNWAIVDTSAPAVVFNHVNDFYYKKYAAEEYVEQVIQLIAFQRDAINQQYPSSTAEDKEFKDACLRMQTSLEEDLSKTLDKYRDAGT